MDTQKDFFKINGLHQIKTIKKAYCSKENILKRNISYKLIEVSAKIAIMKFEVAYS